ncbi:flagellar biosynthetic protein FliR [Azospirillaceae bacterium]
MLQTLIGDNLFLWLFVFMRIGAFSMVVPTIGDPFVPTRSRLAVAIFLTILIAPIVAPLIPKQPDQPAILLRLLFNEIAVGIFIGLVPRLLMGALELAGMIVAIQSSLANAAIFNPAMASQSSLPGALMGWLGIILIFTTNLHHLLIIGAVDSYDLFHPGLSLPWNDFSEIISNVVSHGFSIGMVMAAPFLITGLIFAMALGLLNRMAPQIQVFYIFMSTQVALGLFLFSITLGSMTLLWIRDFEDVISGIFRVHM